MTPAILLVTTMLATTSFSPAERKFMDAVVSAESKSRYRPSEAEEARRTLERLIKLNPSAYARAAAYGLRYPPLPPRRPVDLPSRKP